MSWQSDLQDWIDKYKAYFAKVRSYVEFKRWTTITLNVQALDSDGNGAEGIPAWQYEYPHSSMTTKELWQDVRNQAKQTDYPQLVQILNNNGLTVDETPPMASRIGGQYSKTTS